MLARMGPTFAIEACRSRASRAPHRTLARAATAGSSTATRTRTRTRTSVAALAALRGVVVLLGALVAAMPAVVAAAASPAAAAAPIQAPHAPPRLVTDADLIRAVLELADERLALMSEVACAKRAAGLPLVDTEREAAVVAATARAAGQVGLEPSSVVATIRAQIDLARTAQARVWDAPPGDCDSLAALRERLDRWTPAFARALQLAAAPVRRAARDGTLATLAAEHLASSRWTAADRDALVAALAEVRMHAPPSLARARAVGVLRIGTPADYAPFAVERGGVLHGADVELALALAAALGLEPRFVRTSWRTLMDDLRADAFDVAVGGISVTPEREAVGDFARAHARGGKTAIGRCADAARLHSFATIDRPGVRVVVNPGGTNERFVRAQLKRATVGVHPDNRTIFGEIVAGRADVMFTDDTEVLLQTRLHPQLCRLVKRTWMRADKAVLLQPDRELRDAVDAWLVPEIKRGLPRRLLDAALAPPI